MSFDPNLPAPNSPLASAVMRAQFNGLKVLIDAVQSLTAAQVDSTTSLPSGAAAQVSVSVTGNTLHFTFQIPEGAQGPQGNDGPTGPQGPQGPMGEVSASDLNNAFNFAISGSSNNSNVVGQMSLSVDSSFQQAQIQQIADKLDELILALRR